MKCVMFYEVAPGPFADPADGALGIFTSREAAEEFIHGDPFTGQIAESLRQPVLYLRQQNTAGGAACRQ